ncbi:MAG: SCO family protein [Chitinophagales bacterium]|nr:SCO family protein [Chitinophagales bacterium]
MTVKRLFIPLFTLLICVLTLWKWTYGFNAFTVFSHTLLESGQTPRNIEDIALINQDSSIFHLEDKDTYILMNFVYLNCPSVCHKINNRLENIYQELNENLIPNKLQLLTVSFDMLNDDISRIKRHRAYFGDNIKGWDFAIPYHLSSDKLNNYLTDMGIWAKSAPESSIINHSTYLFLISPEHKIIKVIDPAREDNESIVVNLKSWIASDESSL